MLAKSIDAPFSGDAWLFEIKWDGIRAIAYVDNNLSILSRNGKELAGNFPELASLLKLAPGTVLDGEIVAMREGRPDIQELLPRMQGAGSRSFHHDEAVSLTYIIFDILERGGRPLLDLPLTERRKILREAVLEGPHIVISDPVEDRGEDYYRVVLAKGLEGVVAKRKDSRYQPGARSDAWLKMKALTTMDCVIAGYTEGHGSRNQAFGALILGLYEDEADRDPGKSDAVSLTEKKKKLIFIGKVGSGFSDDDLSRLMEAFADLKTNDPQVKEADRDEKVTWIRPALVCEVAYQEITRERKLRIPRFIRIRTDRLPEECTTGQLRSVEVRALPGEVASEGKRAKPYGSTTETVKTIVPHEPPANESLKRYKEMRDFSRTREPDGSPAPEREGNYFVVQEHHAHRLHYDFRLERDGILKSWAVPKGVPEVAGEKHLAVAVEDHPLDYGHFEGMIPKGEYGAGTVSIWDNGTYETKHWDNEKIEVTLHGHRLRGAYVLVTFKRAGKNEWLLFKP
jgi:DNA ligase D-like protein (predicted ligase)/DNA ligase D-like protein (predicted 3'-phosphoesterase)